MNRKLKKMPKPPSVGICVLCTFLLLGTAKRCFLCETVRIDGIDANVNRNETNAENPIIKCDVNEFIL